ncbi:MAG TPA: glycosyltransferase, partial [Anaerolineales bacterium]|nr:glycosyltransferase [Anaerolineales bacterium]
MIPYHEKVITTTTSEVDTFYPIARKTYVDDGLMDRPTVSVVIPTLNEASNLPLVLPYLPMAWIDEVILVDGRSTDDTVQVAHRLMPSIKVVMETR